MAGTFTRIATTRRPFRDYFLPHRYEKTFILSLFCLLAQDLWAQAVLPGNVVTGYLQVRHGATASAGTHDGNLVVIGPAEIEWAFSPDGQALRLVPGWDFSKNTRFELNGDVAFSRKVTIGNVAT